MRRFDDFNFMDLAQRVAQMISYGQSKKDVVDRLRGEGVDDGRIRLAWAGAEMMLKDEADESSI